jgi:DNA repair protein RadA/Sms
MAIKTIFSCQNCGYQSPKWLGRCPECEQWNSLSEEVIGKDHPSSQRVDRGGIVAEGLLRRISDIESDALSRTSTGLDELDRVLGGGLVKGSVLLIGGEPGIGKSTLMLQASGIISKHRKVLYISGEESLEQLKLRADRLNLEYDNLYLANETDLTRVLGHMKLLNPYAVVIDSIQTLYNPEFSQSAGTVTQIKESAALLTSVAKSLGISLFFIGHITKEGMIAGPKVLEHIVDSVVYFEGQKESPFRILRAIKNRFGATDEIGIFSMDSDGLKQIKDPSGIFILNRKIPLAGSAITAVIEGTRPLLVEVQALVSPSNFGMARHRAMGFDLNRLSLLVAGLNKNLGINLSDQDVFLNIVGGVRINEPTADLCACVSICSSFKDRPVRCDTVIIGEVGLCSETRGVFQINARLNEAKRMGFKRAIISASDSDKIKDNKILDIIPVENVGQALEHALA